MCKLKVKFTLALIFSTLFISCASTGRGTEISEEYGMTKISRKVMEEFCPEKIEIQNWEKNFSLSSSRCSSFQPGDVILLKASVLSNTDRARINVMNTSWQPVFLENVSCNKKVDYLAQNGISKFKFGAESGTCVFTITLSEQDVKILKSGGLLFSGSNFAISSVKISYSKVTYKSKRPLEEQYSLYTSKRNEILMDFEKKYTLPIVYITTNAFNEIEKKEYYDAIVDLTNCNKKYELSEDISKRKAKVKIRGNSTASDVFSPNEKPYKIKFNSKTAMLGLHQNKKYKEWVLLKTGWTIAADYLGFKLAHEIYKSSEFDYYASDSTFVHVVINGSYKGLYLLCEQNQIEDGRVAVSKLKKGEKNPRTGYMIELDNYAWEDVKDGNGRWFGENNSCSKGQNDYHFNIEYLSSNPADNEEYEEWGMMKKGVRLTDVNRETRIVPPDDFTLKNSCYGDSQVIFIRKYMQGLWDICYNAIEKNKFYKFDENYNVVPAYEFKTARQTCEAVIDLDSLCNEMLLEELVRDNDVGAGSLYMAIDFTKLKNEKYGRLTFECPWDFNWAYGTYPQDDDYYRNKLKYFAGAWQPSYILEDNIERSHCWFILFNKADWFQKMQREKWDIIGKENLYDLVAAVESELEIPIKETGFQQETTQFIKNRIEYMQNYLWNNK